MLGLKLLNLHELKLASSELKLPMSLTSTRTWFLIHFWWKKFNLNEPDGFKGYWRDLMKEKQFFPEENLVVALWLCWVHSLGVELLSLRLLPPGWRVQNTLMCWIVVWSHFLQRFPEIIYHQDNVAIRTSIGTQSWFASKATDVLPWPAYSPDLNHIENIWGIPVKQIYAKNCHFSTVNEFKTAILDVWDSKPTNLHWIELAILYRRINLPSTDHLKSTK